MGGTSVFHLHSVKAVFYKLWFCINKRRTVLSPIQMSVKKPLIVVLGCTGTGKSDLGIAISKKFGGEVVSADSMQVYKGLDIATNKVMDEEMDGIPHHMISFVEPSTYTFNIHQFRDKALSVMESLWAAGKLPVVVGGTGYYVEGILFKDSLISTNTTDGKNEFEHLSDDEVYNLLKSVDMESAMQVHKNDRSRVVRALQIYNATGRRKSEFLEEQRRMIKLNLSGRLRYPNLLLLFLDADKEILEDRLNKRVSKMIERGLRKEVEDFYEQYRQCLTAHGVAQSIAVKEFLDYLRLDPNERHSELGEKLFIKGCETLKLHTRQYARRQRRWVKQHLLGGNPPTKWRAIHFLDTSQKFHEVVVPKVLNMVGKFLSDVSDEVCVEGVNSDESKGLFEIDAEYRQLANKIYQCESCKIDVQGALNWEAHLKGKKHRKILRRMRKMENSDVLKL